MKTGHWYKPPRTPTLSPSARQELFAVKVTHNTKGFLPPFTRDIFRAIIIYAWKACGIRVGPKPDDCENVETICFYKQDVNYRTYDMKYLVEVTLPSEIAAFEKQLIILEERSKVDEINQVKWRVEEEKKTKAGFNKFIGMGVKT